jgi:flagellar hook-length control protein FliK
MPVALTNPAPQAAPTSGAATPGSASAPAANGSTASFLLVLAQQITVAPAAPGSAPTSAVAKAALSAPVCTLMPATLAELLPQEGLDTGTDSDSSDTDTDESSDDESALAMAAFLPGLGALAAPPPKAPGATGDAPTGGVNALETASTDAATLAAAEALLNATDAEPDADSSTTPTNPATQAAHAAQAHSGLTHHVATSTDAAQMARDLRAPVGTPAWNDELGGRLTWMAANGRESASLRLSPENLGPLEVRISVQDGEAKVWFGATHADTRSALEQSLPRLREMFASQGLVLADSGVFRDAPREHASTHASSDATPTAEQTGDASVTSVTIAHAGLVDTYV